MIRTFIAVELPDSMKKAIEALQQEIDFKGLKLVEPQLVHVTLKFLGDIPPAQVEPVANALSHIDCKPFTARIAGVGVFPNPSYMKVVWLGAHGDFEHLHAEVESVLKGLGFRPDRGKFTGHATLARVKYFDETTKAQLSRALAKLQDIAVGEYRVDSIAFKKSTLTPKGPIYENLREIPLRSS